MNCHREDELLDALGRGFIGPELTAHLAECESCRELQLVAGAVLEDRADAIEHSPVPSGGTMLFRMKMRLQQDAATAARRSLLIGQAATLLIAVALTLAFFGRDLADEALQAIAAIRLSTPLLLAVATSLLVAPIAGWVAIRQK